MQSEAKTKLGLSRQLITCAIMSGLAVAVILIFQQKPYWPTLFFGMYLPTQVAIGLALGSLYWICATLGYKFAAGRKSVRHIAESYSRLDLTGWNPLWIALAAGFGEELLFRGALQPVLGIWATSVLFVLAHIRAYRFNGVNKRVLIQSLGLFAVSVVFGYIAQWVGLIAVIIVHAAMDVVGLYTIRRAALVPATAAT